MKSNLIASIINCWYNTSLSLLPLLGKHLRKTASRRVKISWLCFNHRKKTKTQSYRLRCIQMALKMQDMIKCLFML